MLRRAPALRHAGVVFIRKTATRVLRDGGSYTSFRLVGSVRSGSQVSQRTLLNLGSGFAVHVDSLEPRGSAPSAASCSAWNGPSLCR